MAGSVRKRQRGEHENNGCTSCELAHECVPASGTENRLASACSEGCTHLGTLARLQKDDSYQGNTDNYVKCDKNNSHFCFYLQKKIQSILNTTSMAKNKA